MVGSAFVIAILLLSSSDLADLHLANSHFTPDSGPVPTPAIPFLPYVVSPAQFPTPDTILSSLGNLTNPQLTTSLDQNQTVFELTYTVANPNGSNATVMYTAGRYDPAWAACITSPANCTGRPTPHLPINWSAPVSLFTHLAKPFSVGLQVAVAATGSMVAVAVSNRNQTNVSLAGNYGMSSAWNLITPTSIPGNLPKLAMAPCALVLTTVKASALTATTFNLPCGLPQTPGTAGGGGGQPGGHPPGGAQPQVNSVSPNFGNQGTPVTINGANFAPSATVAFASTAAWTVAYVSSTKLTAVAPPGSGKVNVTVTVGSLTSPINPPYDQFQYQPPVPPAVHSVIPATALPDTWINVTGATFDSSSQVLFGGRAALKNHYVNSTDVEALVPWGVGRVDIQVYDADLGLTSVTNPGDLFTFAVEAASLPASVTAAPVTTPNPNAVAGTTEGVVATELGDSSAVYFRSINGGANYTSFLIGKFTTSIGSPLLSTLGSTRVFLGSGIPAQTASVSVGTLVFSLFTTQLENRTVVETASSTNGGQSWTGPYPAAPIIGTLADPELAASTAGYVYGTWLENGNGSWQLDQAVFAESGQLLFGPNAIPGSISGSSAIIANPTIAVDDLARPIYVWASVNATTNLTQLEFTGAFPPPSTVASDVSQAFTQTESEPWDFTVQGSLQTTFDSSVTSALTSVQSAISAGKICSIQYRVVHMLGPLLSTNLLKPLIPGVYLPSVYCSLAVPAPATDIVNSTGPFSADTYLGVYLAWLAEASGFAKVKEPFWPGAPGNPDANDTLASTPSAPSYLPDQAVNTTGEYYTFAVQPVTVNPNTLWLNVSGIPFGQQGSGGEISCERLGFGTSGEIDITYNDNATAQWAVVTVTQPSGTHSFLLHGFFQSSFLTNLEPGVEGTWSMTVHTNYTETESNTSTCSNGKGTTAPKVISFTTGMPQHLTVGLTSNFTTYEETVPAGLVVHEVANKTSGGNAYDYIAWNNSIVSQANTTIRGPSHYSQFIDNFNNSTAENTGQFAIPLGKAYNVYANITSEWGPPSDTWNNQLYTGLNGGVVSAAEAGGSSCSFTESPNPIAITWLTGSRIQGVTDSNATLTWFSNESGRGWASYNASDDGAYTQTALEIPNAPGHPANYPYEYRAVLNGLSPWNVYRVTIGVSTYNGCLEFDNGVAWNVQVNAIVQPQVMDYPYDSVTQEGGGARLTWSVPSLFATAGTFENGTVTYCQWTGSICVANTTVQIPLPSLSTLAGGSQFTYSWLNSTFQVNLTGLSLNTLYNATVLLNYTLKGAQFVAESRPYDFTYEKDTSGDGLTDWEKLRGWNVTTQWDGSFYSNLATANPLKYATNGITSDFIEKEFGINPNLLSTTGDGMLDAWNLTFDLGPSATAVLPSTGFQYWYENGSYQFNHACPSPAHGPTCSFSPLGATDESNLTATGTSSPGGDDSPWGAEVLWSGTGTGNALSQLEALLPTEGGAVPLRAVTGSYSISGVSHRTITVWGKLSWGADPLAYSTPEYSTSIGFPGDGQRVDPLGVTDLNVTVDSWSMDNLAAGDGVAAFIDSVSVGAPLYAHRYASYGNYASSINATGAGVSDYAQFTVNFEVPTTLQNAPLNFSLVAKTAAGYVWHNFSVATIDLENTSAHALAYGTHGTPYTLNASYQVVPVYSKANTILILPGDNSTLSKLPTGLTRYTGEQSFVLLEVNDTDAGASSLSIGAVPYVNSTAPNGISTAGYTIALSGGMNNILVPRSLFIHSPLGQELLLNSTNVSITSHSYNSFLQSHWDPATWQARVLNYSNWNGSDFAAGHWGFIKTFSNSNQNCTTSTKCGQVPENLADGQQVPTYAINSIFTMNLSSGNALANLSAGLLLNSSGNFTNWALSATQYLPSFGLAQNVLAALANPSLFSQGGYGAPKYNAPAPPPPAWQRVGDSVWDTVSGVVSGALSVTWGWVQSAGAFADYLASEVASFGLFVVHATEVALTAIARAIVWAIEQLATIILRAVSTFLQVLSDGIALLIKGYASGIAGAFDSVFSNLTSSSPTSAGIMGSIGGLLLSLFGFSGLSNTLSQGLSTVMSMISPILDLVSPARIVNVISGAFGGGVGASTVNSVMGSLSGIVLSASGLIANGLGSAVGALLNGNFVPTLPGSLPTFPTGAQINSDSETVISAGSGLSGYFGNLLSQSYNTVDIAEIAHVGIVISVMLFLLLNLAVKSSIQGLGDFLDLYVPAFGGETVALGDLPVMIGAEIFSLFISLIGLILSPILNWVESFVLEFVGALAATYSSIVIVTNPISYPAGGGGVVPLLSVLGAGSAWLPPIFTGLSND